MLVEEVDDFEIAAAARIIDSALRINLPSFQLLEAVVAKFAIMEAKDLGTFATKLEPSEINN